jgi:hypothetical protein
VKRHIFLLTGALILAGGGTLVLRERAWALLPRGEILRPISAAPDGYELIRRLEKAGIPAADFPAISGEVLAASVSGVRVLFSREKDLDLQVRALQLVLPGVRMEEKRVEEIDLRFDKIILRYGPR